MSGADEAQYLERIKRERNALVVERERLYRLEAAISARSKRIDQKLEDCVAAGRLFGEAIAIPNWNLVFKSSLEDEMSRIVNREWARPATTLDLADEEEEMLKAILEEARDTEEIESRPAGMPSIREIVVEKLTEAGTEGTKAASIREFIEMTYAADIHVKTVGMTLYRLVKDGLARREGRVWYFVPPTKIDEASGTASEDEEPEASEQNGA